MYRREGGDSAAEGVYLLRLDSAGIVAEEFFLGNSLRDQGVEEWTDFRVTDGKLLLQGKVLASQPQVQSKRNAYGQNVISIYDLASRALDSRLIPLDMRYLEAAMNAGDAEIQNLPGLPGGDPARVTEVGDLPLDVTVGWIDHKQVLRLNPAGPDLAPWSPSDEKRRQAEIKDRSQLGQQSEMAAYQQMMESMADGSYMDAMAAELEKQINDPNLPPELKAQLEQTLQQMRQQK